MERRTRQRDAVQRVIDEASDPLTPQDIHDAAQTHAPGLGIATVYRTLKLLEGGGEIVAVELPGEPARYESAGLGHHHHFHCRQCGRVFDVADCPKQLERITPPGFRLERHEVLLYGVCAGCLGG
jgi:Fur family ferric uptake transcriptional regulator